MTFKKNTLCIAVTCVSICPLFAIPKAGEEKNERKKMEKVLKSESKTKKLFTSNTFIVVNKDGTPKKGEPQLIKFTRSGKITDNNDKQIKEGEFRWWMLLKPDSKSKHPRYRLAIKKEKKSGWYTFEYNHDKKYWKGPHWGYKLHKEVK